ncbi:O-methyltransferase [Saxibacter everestensis]|uniref:O-methyltransferase n=1 Tax=Saxibacter everestensis TaxID=2909229 RepID=A0ABY8QNK5_9MICO|nr:O-methyltransferase [Brevibacteriaceae bacterium ZFBP1038]
MSAGNTAGTYGGASNRPAQNLANTKVYAEGFHTDDEVLDAARSVATQLGVVPISPGVGHLLQVLTAAAEVHSAVEVGTGTGVAGVSIFRGMGQDGILTTMDVEPERQRVAREIFRAEGITAHRVRSITGRAEDVLPRLADASYDLVFIDIPPTSLAASVPHAIRILRKGGVLAMHQVFQHGAVADPSNREPGVQDVRRVLRMLKNHEHLLSALVPIGDGLFTAVKR